MCIFCKIANKEIPSYTVYEDDNFLAFLDLSPITVGHTLVVPKKHYANLLELDEATAKEALNVARKVALLLKEKLNVSDFNIVNNCGENAGQSVHHFHIHVIPIYKKGDLEFKVQTKKLSDEDFKKLHTKIIK
ncbi:MAG TPA: HIT family protein [Acholeplasma sp.]|jgi:histidine triad (HIT) family protein|nr:HIT family protein [Acholeplasma sp.]